jgi:phosphoribosylamine-glycine ligase
MQTNNITAHTEDASQIEAVKAFMKALKIKFEISKEKSYNPEFVKKIEKSKKELKEGKSTRVKKEDLQSFLGL